MAEFAAGDAFDCEWCDGRHLVRRGKDGAVAGREPRVRGTPYVRCPAVGVVDLAGGTPEPVGTPSDDGDDDWP